MIAKLLLALSLTGTTTTASVADSVLGALHAPGWAGMNAAPDRAVSEACYACGARVEADLQSIEENMILADDTECDSDDLAAACCRCITQLRGYSPL